MRRAALKFGFSLLGLSLLIFLMPSCGLQTPSLQDKRTLGASFSHEAFKDSCTSCHEVHRPAPVNGTAHGSGMDCVKCHTYTGGWKGGVTGFSHTPTPSSCTTCHENKRPAPISGVLHGSGMDCVKCHTYSGGWKGGVTGFSHNPMPTSCTTCHENKRPAPFNGNIHGNNLDCVSCHTTTSNWKTGISYPHPANLTSCNSCHDAYRPPTGVRNLNYNNSAPFHKPGLYDGSHYSGKDCASCHRIPQTGTASWNFNHRNYQSQNVGFCLSCHFSDGWNKHSGNTTYFADYGTCFNCHNAKVKSWDR